MTSRPITAGWCAPVRAMASRSRHQHGTLEWVTAADDLRLLRRYEPVLRFTEGELFLPMPAVALLLASIRDFFIKR